MIIKDVFQINGRGTIVTGRVGKGSVSIGDTLRLMDSSGNIISETITIKNLDIGFARVRPTTAEEGLNVGLVIGKVDIDIQPEYILTSL